MRVHAVLYANVYSGVSRYASRACNGGPRAGAPPKSKKIALSNAQDAFPAGNCARSTSWRIRLPNDHSWRLAQIGSFVAFSHGDNQIARTYLRQLDPRVGGARGDRAEGS
jgi:hypothetical protein